MNAGEEGVPGGDRPFEVDISSLTKLAKALRDEVDHTFDPQAGSVNTILDPGVDPPAKPALSEWEAARGRYYDGRARHLDLLNAFQAATLLLSEAADAIGRRYQESDQFARATLSDVHDAFAQAGRKYGIDLDSLSGGGDA